MCEVVKVKNKNTNNKKGNNMKNYLVVSTLHPEIGVTRNMERDVSMYGYFRLCPINCVDIERFTFKEAKQEIKNWKNDGMGNNVSLSILNLNTTKGK